MRVKSSTKLAKKQHDPLVQNQKNLNNDIATTSASLASIKSPKDDNDDCSNDNDDNQLATIAHISNRTSNGKHCQHLNKSINNMNVLKKNLKQAVIGECSSCNEAKSKSSEFKRSKDTSLWLCLYCAHQGCDRHSEHSHALKHYQTPRSVLHCVCLNLSTWSLWCYECDDELANCSKRIDEIINGVRKLCSSNMAHHSSSGQTVEPTTTETHHTQPNHNSKTSQSSVQKTLVIAQQLLTSQLTSNRKSANTSAITSSSSSLATHNTKVVGLNNLGNTCFFNAVLQVHICIFDFFRNDWQFFLWIWIFGSQEMKWNQWSFPKKITQNDLPLNQLKPICWNLLIALRVALEPTLPKITVSQYLENQRSELHLNIDKESRANAKLWKFVAREPCK